MVDNLLYQAEKLSTLSNSGFETDKIKATHTIEGSVTEWLRSSAEQCG